MIKWNGSNNDNDNHSAGDDGDDGNDDNFGDDGNAGDDGDDVAKFAAVLCFVNNGPISTLSQCTQVAFMTFFFPKLNQQRAHDIYWHLPISSLFYFPTTKKGFKAQNIQLVNNVKTPDVL